MRNDNSNNKGFTLVELIVVLVILAILAAIMVPALLGYIDRAKGQKYIIESKEIMTAAQAGIVEAYAKDKKSFVDYVKKNKYPGIEHPYDYVTNHLFATHQGNGSSATTPAKDIIADSLLKYVDSEKGKAHKYTFSSDTPSGKKASSIAKGQVAFVICYNTSGRILFMQYARDGYLVTFDGKSYTVEADGQFVAY